MCRGVLESFRLANKPVPKTLYIDRGCCRAQGPTSVETMFQAWFDGGMVVRLDIFHWIHRFDTAIRTTINNVDLPYYKSLRGSNSLEGFHKSLPHMIPGPHCAARPYQVYLISGIARWNGDRSLDISAMNNRLMYTLVKLLWLKSPQGSRTSPEKTTILKAYERIQHRVLVDDPVLSKAGFPLPKINIKTVRDFIRAQERLVNLLATNQPAMLSKTTSVSSAHSPPAPHQPAVLPPPDYPLMQYVPTPSTAGTKLLKGRRDMIAPLTPSDITATCVTATNPSPQTFALHLSIHGNPGDCWPLHKAHRAIAARPILPATSTIARPMPSLFPGPIVPASQPTQPLLAPPQCPYCLPFRQPRLLMCLSPLLSSAFPHPGQGPILPASQPTPAIAGPSSMPLLPAIQATPSVAGLDVSVLQTMPEIPATLECSPSSWARAMLYKRKVMDEPSGVGTKVSRVFVWRPVGVWRYSLKCPRGDNCVGSGRNVHLSKSGYHSKVRLICGVSGWYTVITEVLSCGPCTKAARSKEGVSVGRWLAWGNAILSQLSEAHQAIFPAVLTTMRGVDRNVVRLLRDRTEGNTMEKVWRQVQENHGGQSPHQALLPDGGQRVRLRVQEVQTLKYERGEFSDEPTDQLCSIFMVWRTKIFLLHHIHLTGWRKVYNVYN
ncbi:Protein PRR14L [Dissostichus eleginoides]|uniref:Protein PRR14L n=1 Tax=Dissostichus eleginoides TaxID=100907 RepID=A0AAD9F611_DISEL|nr:Protein PRR14L [Dissostichus eleginoides]